MSDIKEIYRKLIPERVRVAVYQYRHGRQLSPLSAEARRQFRYLSQYYPPIYYPGYLQKIVALDLLLNLIKKHRIAGDIVECGVGRGLSFFILGVVSARLELGCRLFGFDSFQGFPEPSEFDQSDRRARKGDLWSETSVEHVRSHLIDAGLAEFVNTHVILVPGFFEDTLHTVTGLDSISFLNLDVDLYDSYRTCMQAFGPRVNGLILYDEYNSPKWPGATLAIDEMLPGLEHTLFYSIFLQKYFSLPDASLDTAFGHDVMETLQGEAAIVGEPAT